MYIHNYIYISTDQQQKHAIMIMLMMTMVMTNVDDVNDDNQCLNLSMMF